MKFSHLVPWKSAGMVFWCSERGWYSKPGNIRTFQVLLIIYFAMTQETVRALICKYSFLQGSGNNLQDIAVAFFFPPWNASLRCCSLNNKFGDKKKPKKNNWCSFMQSQTPASLCSHWSTNSLLELQEIWLCIRMLHRTRRENDS